MQPNESSRRRRHHNRVQGGWAAGQGHVASIRPLGPSPSQAQISQVHYETPVHDARYQIAIADHKNPKSKMKAEVPNKFTWIKDELVCAMALPDRPEHLQYLVEQNVRYLVNLTEDISYPTDNFPELKVIRIGIKDFSTPAFDQVMQFLDIVKQAKEEKKAAGVHCRMGKGRTGTLLTCFLVAYNNMSAKEAVQHMSQLRRRSYQTTDQENFVHLFEEYYRKQRKSRKDIGEDSR